MVIRISFAMRMAGVPLGSGLVVRRRRLEHALQRQQAFAPQLDLFPEEPHVVALRYRLFLELDAKLILFNPPLAGPFATHRSALNGAVSPVEVAPMNVIRQFHSAELGADLS